MVIKYCSQQSTEQKAEKHNEKVITHSVITNLTISSADNLFCCLTKGKETHSQTGLCI